MGYSFQLVKCSKTLRVNFGFNLEAIKKNPHKCVCRIFIHFVNFSCLVAESENE